MKKLLSLSCCALIGTMTLVEAKDLSLKAIETYMNTTLKKFTGNFKQVDPRGSVSYGVVALMRPGKMLIDNIKPRGLVIFSDGEDVFFIDRDSKDINQSPIEQSLAALMLSDTFALNSPKLKVKKYTQDEKKAYLTIQRKENEDLGSLTLEFQKEPLKLTRWTVLDAQGYETEVTLTRLCEGCTVNFTYNADKEIPRLLKPAQKG